MAKEVFENLKDRGYIFQTSNEAKVRELLEHPPVTIYQGFDPSADSFHLGQLMCLMLLHHLQEAGHRIIFLVGGGTGLVGDPSGKTKSRVLLSPEQVRANVEKLKVQVEKMGLLKFSGKNPAVILNNYDWLGKFLFVDDFLLKVAKVFSVNEMVKYETFSKRLAENQPLSLLEFCYPVLQGWDFLTLFEKEGCQIQVGGQDQWVNILAGVTLVRRIHNQEVFAMSHPLLTTSGGAKMGKTEKGALWLDPSKTSPFEFYQYLIQTPDADVPKLLTLLTFLTKEEIDAVIKKPREAQRRLAYEVTKIVHGEEEAKKAQGMESMPTKELPQGGSSLSDLLPISRSEIKRRCEQGAVTIDGEKILDPKAMIGKPCTIKYGKNDFLKVA